MSSTGKACAKLPPPGRGATQCIYLYRTQTNDTVAFITNRILSCMPYLANPEDDPAKSPASDQPGRQIRHWEVRPRETHAVRWYTTCCGHHAPHRVHRQSATCCITDKSLLSLHRRLASATALVGFGLWLESNTKSPGVSGCAMITATGSFTEFGRLRGLMQDGSNSPTPGVCTTPVHRFSY